MIRNIQKFLRGKRKDQPIQDRQQKDASQDTLSKSFDKNIEWFKLIFENCSDVIFHEFRPFGTMKAIIIYNEGLVDTALLQNDVLLPLTKKHSADQEWAIEHVKNSMAVANTSQTRLLDDCIESISTGKAILLIEGEKDALSLSLTKYHLRAIEEPQAEKVIRGPRAGFIESIQVNISLIRRIIKSPALKIKSVKLGKYSETTVSVAYIEGIADSNLIAEIESRLQKVSFDGILDSNYIEEVIEDNPYSPFPQLLSTERPDVASANLLEGRAVILVDGSPFVLVAPFTFSSLIQAPDDYYERYIVGTFLRFLRYIFLAVALFFPSLYVAITTYHQEMLPDQLLLSLATARETVPYTAVIEVLIMELMLEALREAGVRLPTQIGSAVSIVGALVIGQSAVQAGLVSAPIVIVVAATGIASFMIPRYTIGYSIRFLRFPLVILAGFLGLLGIMLGFLAIVIHLCSLRSFGEPYLAPFAPLKKKELKDTLWRAPLWMMNQRPHLTGDKNMKRQGSQQKPGLNSRGEAEK